MKNLLKFLPIAMIALTFASCSKDYTCTCTDSAGEVEVTTIPDAKKADAKTACDALDTIYLLLGGNCELD